MNSIPIPFYANTADDTRCVQACFRMALKHFTPQKEYTWDEVDAICHAKLGKGTWWFPALVELQTRGLLTKMISSLDYKRLENEKFAYLNERTNENVAAWYETHSNLASVLPLLPAFLQSNIWEQRAATLNDIDYLLADDWLVGIEVNAKILNNKEGLSPHMVLVFAKNDDHYVFHDPGLPPHENRTMTPDELVKMWQFAGKENTSLVAIGK